MQQFSEERHALQTKIFVLEGEVSRLKRESSVSKDSEMFELKMKCEQLVKTVEALEEQLQQQVRCTGSREVGVNVGEVYWW